MPLIKPTYLTAKVESYRFFTNRYIDPSYMLLLDHIKNKNGKYVSYKPFFS
jgi:hypothetical protein